MAEVIGEYKQQIKPTLEVDAYVNDIDENEERCGSQVVTTCALQSLDRALPRWRPCGVALNFRVGSKQSG